MTNQREFKFRAWNKEQKIMVYENEDNIQIFSIGTILNRIQLIHRLFNDDRYIFMQYTGVKDREDKEIYEGDILETEISYVAPWKPGRNNSKGIGNIIGMVIIDHPSRYLIDQGETYFFQINPRYMNFEDWSFGHAGIKAKVIGNIHEKPEFHPMNIEYEYEDNYPEGVISRWFVKNKVGIGEK